MAFYGALGTDNDNAYLVGGRHKNRDRRFAHLIMYDT